MYALSKLLASFYAGYILSASIAVTYLVNPGFAHITSPPILLNV